MRLQPLKKQPASHAILRRNPFSVYECGVMISDFLSGGRVKQNMTRGVDSLAKIGHPMFLQF